MTIGETMVNPQISVMMVDFELRFTCLWIG
jgi:hypothetical protein